MNIWILKQRRSVKVFGTGYYLCPNFKDLMLNLSHIIICLITIVLHYKIHKSKMSTLPITIWIVKIRSNLLNIGTNKLEMKQYSHFERGSHHLQQCQYFHLKDCNYFPITRITEFERRESREWRHVTLWMKTIILLKTKTYWLLTTPGRNAIDLKPLNKRPRAQIDANNLKK